MACDVQSVADNPPLTVSPIVSAVELHAALRIVAALTKKISTKTIRVKINWMGVEERVVRGSGWFNKVKPRPAASTPSVGALYPFKSITLPS